MRSLRRLAEPAALAKHKAEWTQKYVASRGAAPGKRPPSRQYAHQEIVDALQAMSAHKCFYCEQSTKECGFEVDHAVEIDERPDLAFEWSNLYLACPQCNGRKLTNQQVPVAECVDPCNAADEPGAHLDFDRELIHARDGSARGAATIKKYRLDRDELDRKRARQLLMFVETIYTLCRRMAEEKRSTLTEEERKILERFKAPDRPFSLMFEVYLRNHPL